ncbi:MAG: Rrf2 family transcriptional regulator [Candidatus Sericytochromatia bacterium]
MKISAVEEYALRCLVQLAKSENGTPVSAEEISTRELLSPAYVEKILQRLNKVGFVKSLRGTKGGYILVKSSDEIMIGDVIRAVDGDFSSEMCGSFSGYSPECTHIGGCAIRPLWKNIYKYIFEVLDKTTLLDLIKDEKDTAFLLEQKFSENLKEPVKI